MLQKILGIETATDINGKYKTSEKNDSNNLKNFSTSPKLDQVEMERKYPFKHGSASVVGAVWTSLTLCLTNIKILCF